MKKAIIYFIHISSFYRGCFLQCTLLIFKYVKPRSKLNNEIKQDTEGLSRIFVRWFRNVIDKISSFSYSGQLRPRNYHGYILGRLFA